MDSLLIIPEEMWIRVLDNLTTHEDLLAAYYTCQLWNSLLGKKQTEWMFQGVFPSLMKYLPAADILNCRHVSKRWNKIIDSFLESDQSTIIHNSENIEHLSHYILPQRYLRVNLNTDREGLEYFKLLFNPDYPKLPRSVKNPFVARSLELTVKQVDWLVLDFFETFGVHLWSLHLTIDQRKHREFVSPLEFFQFIWNILRLVPNLKRLVLDTQQDLRRLFQMFPYPEEWNPQKLELKQFLESNAVPPLPSLNNFQLLGWYYMLRQPLESAFAPQLNKFVYDMSENMRKNEYEFVPKNLTKVTELVCFYRSDSKVPYLNKLDKLNCPLLQRLCIIMRIYDRWGSPAKVLFNELETFKHSLKYLSIFWCWHPPTFPSQLHLPFVEEVCLELYNCPDPINIAFSFLATMTSLRKLKFILEEETYLAILELRKNRERNERSDESVDLQYYLSLDKDGELYKSNVWRLVPTLETVEVHVSVWVKAENKEVKNVKLYTRSEMARNDKFDYYEKTTL